MQYNKSIQKVNMETLDSSDTGRIFAQERGSGVNKLLLMLGVVAVLLSSVALVVALLSLTQNGGTTTFAVTGQQGSNAKNDRIWTIATGHAQSNGLYIDQTSGQLRGFTVDMINAVCRLANKDCRLVYDVWQHCWESEKGQVPRGGVGLMSGWYDACAGWIKAHTRARTFKFSKSWNKPIDFYFAIKTGNPRGFNPTDVTDMKFGFVDGFVNDEFCLARQTSIKGSTLPVSQMQHYDTYDDMLNAVISGEVDVCISYGSTALPPGLTKIEDPVLDCSMDSSGFGLMMRMDNPLVEWWDPALERLMQTSEYWEICQDVKDQHGHMPGRDPKEMCIGY
ncbi:uncharacterized protein [Amphiura filiformis]|uniref:uncharacterized protein isoform X2 n=1 Tax=Amphiura filiformis TaxID=82378 RepID=UPI003B215131